MSAAHTTALQPFPCWHCGYVIDASTNTAEDAPVPAAGDVSMCLSCGALGFYATGPIGLLTVRPATVDEVDELRRDPQVRRALAARSRVVGDSLPKRDGR